MGAAVMDKFRFAQELQSRKEKYYRMAYSYVKNEQDALDIVGEAVYKGLRTLGTLRQPDYFDTWMTRIVINAAIDFTRRRSRVTLCEDGALEILAVPEEELTPEDSMDLYRALDILGERERVCVTLRYFEEQLPGDLFFRCHHGFLVNMAYVSSIGKSDVEVEGHHLPVGRQRKRAFMEAFARFLGDSL